MPTASPPTPYFADDAVTIYHGDCREILPHVRADVLVTDPPYGVRLGAQDVGGRTGRHGLNKDGYASYDDTVENFVSIVVPIVRSALAMTKRGVVFCAGVNAWRLPPADQIGGVFLPSGAGRTCWGFNNFSHALLYGSAPDLFKGSKPTGISSTDASQPNGHPCPKPLRWMLWAVGLAAAKSDVVIDPFMGSGTTLRAAKDLGIRAIGIEREERYCEIAARRMAQQTLFATSADATRRDALAASISTRFALCSLDELRVLDVILERVLKVGRESYAPLDLARDERDWSAEAAAELADTLFYLAARDVAANDRRLEQLRREAAREMRAHPRESDAETVGGDSFSKPHDWPGPDELGDES